MKKFKVGDIPWILFRIKQLTENYKIRIEEFYATHRKSTDRKIVPTLDCDKENILSPISASSREFGENSFKVAESLKYIQENKSDYVIDWALTNKGDSFLFKLMSERIAYLEEENASLIKEMDDYCNHIFPQNPNTGLTVW